MAARSSRSDDDAKAKEKAAKAKEKAAKAKAKEKAAKAEEKEKAAKAKAKEKAAKAKAKEKAAKAKAKEKAAKAKDKEKAAKAKDKEKAAKAKEKAAKAKAKEKAAKAKDKEKAAKAKEKERAAKAKEKERAAQATAKAEENAVGDEAGTAEDGATRAETTEEEAAPAPEQDAEGGGVPSVDLPAGDTTIRPKGLVAEQLGKEDAVGRSTQRATLAASYTTRDHDVIRAWAESRGGRPADVEGTGNSGAGVLRIEFPDGPGDDSRLEGVDWSAFFATFDDSDVDFLYQERVRTGDVSRFHKFVRADA